jgi:hypothetical protein
MDTVDAEVVDAVFDIYTGDLYVQVDFKCFSCLKDVKVHIRVQTLGETKFIGCEQCRIGKTIVLDTRNIFTHP